MALSRWWTGITLVYAMVLFSFLRFKRGQRGRIHVLPMCENCIQPQVGYQFSFISSQT